MLAFLANIAQARAESKAAQNTNRAKTNTAPPVYMASSHGVVDPTFVGQEYFVTFCGLMSLVVLYGRYYLIPEYDENKQRLLERLSPLNSCLAAGEL